MNGLTTNTGQICFAATRVYVQDGIYDKFLAAYKEAIAVKREKMGDPENASSEIGPVVDQAQNDRILEIIHTAKRENQGTLLQGGEERQSNVGIGLPCEQSILLTFSRDSISSLQSSWTLMQMLQLQEMRYSVQSLLSTGSRRRLRWLPFPMTLNMA